MHENRQKQKRASSAMLHKSSHRVFGRVMRQGWVCIAACGELWRWISVKGHGEGKGLEKRLGIVVG